jgi:hypothetical protein
MNVQHNNVQMQSYGSQKRQADEIDNVTSVLIPIMHPTSLMIWRVRRAKG